MEYDIEGGDVDFWMEEDDAFNVRSTFLREMLSERKSEGEIAMITLKGSMKRTILMSI